MQKQIQIFENQTERDLIIWIEMNPDQYILNPGDVFEITYDHEGDRCGLQTIVHDDQLQIFLDHFDTAVVTINGEPAEPWST